jgi:hypothetical protein
MRAGSQTWGRCRSGSPACAGLGLRSGCNLGGWGKDTSVVADRRAPSGPLRAIDRGVVSSRRRPSCIGGAVVTYHGA